MVVVVAVEEVEDLVETMEVIMVSQKVQVTLVAEVDLKRMMKRHGKGLELQNHLIA